MQTISEHLEALIKPVELRLKLVWLIQFFSYAIYIFIAFMAKTEFKEFSSPENKISISIAFTAIAVGIIVASLIFRWLLLSPTAVGKLLRGTYPNWALTGNKVELPLAVIKELESLSSDERILLKFSMSSFNLFLMDYGFVNSCPIAGLVLSILIGSSVAVIPFVVCAVIIQLFKFPNLKKLFEEGLLEKNSFPN